MSYYIINGIPVFLTWSRYYQLREEIVSRNKIDDDRFYGVRGWDSKETELLSSTISEILLEKSCKDISLFRKQWANFSMGRDEASDNARELLFDYCQFTRNAILSDIAADQINQEVFPHASLPGRIFALSLPAPEKSLLKRLRGGTRLAGRLIIDSEQVASIEGSLEDFLMIYRSLPIRFYSCIEIT